MGRRLFTSGRWNWSQKAETLTIKMKELNEKLLKTQTQKRIRRYLVN